MTPMLQCLVTNTHESDMPYQVLSRSAAASLAAAALLAVPATSSWAGVTYRLDRPAAVPGETVTLEAIFFNDGNTDFRWEAPSQLVLQWRNAQGGVVRSVATLPGEAPVLEIPANNFARLSWNVVVPAQARGMQAISIEGDSAMLALEATGRSGSQVAATPADVPVVDARTGEPLPVPDVVATGASPVSGSAPTSADAAHSPFQKFTSAISEYQPMYFSVGTRGGTTARFQISAKYRLFTPPSDRPARFYEQFYLGYTQTSLWDLEGDSMPFVDTTFNPSVFWLSDNLLQSEDHRWRLGLNTGVEHNSNGKGGEDSRSINDIYMQPAISHRFDAGTLTFAPKAKLYFSKENENADFADYAGYVDWNLRWTHNNGAVLSALYRQGDHNRRTTQLDFAWPLQRTWLNMNGYLHVQYFNGYGETMLDYNRRNSSQVRLGLSIVP